MTIAWILLWASCSEPEYSDSAELVDDSGEDTNTKDPIESPMFESAAVCGECHVRQYEEWRGSMHAYAALSPTFYAVVAKAHRDTAGEVGTFCTGCHTPLGTLAGESGSAVAAERSALSREGVTCEVCHTAVSHVMPVGNTGLVFDGAGPKQGSYASDGVEGHLSEESSFTTSPELCGSCHDVFNFPGLYIEEAYTEYLASPARANGERCQDCHMGTEPGVPGTRPMGPSAEGAAMEYPDRELTSHKFVGPDYSLLDDFPFPNDLNASAVAQEEYAEDVLTLLQNGAEISSLQVQSQGSFNEVRVQVRNKTTGHNVPTGFTSERQLWLEVTATGQSGTVYYQSGDLDSYGDLRNPHSWDVKSGAVDLDASLFNLQSSSLHRFGNQDEALPGSTGTPLELTETIFPFDADFIYKRSLAPGEVREVFYTFPGVAEPVEVSVRLRYRNLAPYVLRAVQADALVSRLRIFTIDSEQGFIQ